MLEDGSMYQPGPVAPRVNDAHNPAAVAFARKRLKQLKMMMPGLQLPKGQEPTALWRSVSSLMGAMKTGQPPQAALGGMAAAEGVSELDHATMARQALAQMLQRRQPPQLGQASEPLRRAAQMAALRHQQTLGASPHAEY